MLDIKQVLKEIGAKNGLEMSLDENGACSLELADGRGEAERHRSEQGRRLGRLRPDERARFRSERA